MKQQIDRNERARIAVQIRHDSRLTPQTKHVAHALLFAFMGALGRAWPSYETLAKEAGCSLSTAKRAVRQLVDSGYISKTRRWGKMAIKRAGRWVPACMSNVYVWLARLSVIPTLEPRTNRSPESKLTVPALPEGLARVLERLGTSIAERKEALQGVQDASP